MREAPCGSWYPNLDRSTASAASGCFTTLRFPVTWDRPVLDLGWPVGDVQGVRPATAPIGQPHAPWAAGSADRCADTGSPHGAAHNPIAHAGCGRSSRATAAARRWSDSPELPVGVDIKTAYGRFDDWRAVADALETPPQAGVRNDAKRGGAA
jgi:hypothetical protein